MSRLRRWFRDLPLERKLSGITTCVVLAALLPIAGVTLGYEYHAVRSAGLQEVRIQADIIRDNTAAALAFGDQSAATEVLDTLRDSPGVVQAALTLPDGSLFAHYIRNGTVLHPTQLQRQTDQEILTGDRIEVARSVHLKSQTVGWLVLESSLEELHERIRFYALFIVFSTLVALGLAHLLARFLIASITRPLSRLVTLTRNVASQEDYTLREAVDSQDEIGDLSQAFNTMLSHIHERDVRLNQLAYRDSVTGLFNRHYFKERAEQAVGNAMRYGWNCCLMFIDLDRFKAVNDTLGHDVGDELLQEVALRLSKLLRTNDVICRIGGDEFAVVVENIKNFDGVTAMAEKMVQALAQPVSLRGHDILIGASIGISVCPDHAHSVTELLRCADIAMYQAKTQGRGQFSIYNKDRDKPSSEAVTS